MFFHRPLFLITATAHSPVHLLAMFVSDSSGRRTVYPNSESAGSVRFAIQRARLSSHHVMSHKTCWERVLSIPRPRLRHAPSNSHPVTPLSGTETIQPAQGLLVVVIYNAIRSCVVSVAVTVEIPPSHSIPKSRLSKPLWGMRCEADY